MDCQLFTDYFKERIARHRDLQCDQGRQRVIYVDNFSGHNSTEELQNALPRLNATLKYFASNASDLIQSADPFVISKIKDYWKKRNQKKLELIRDGQWQDRVH